MRIVRYLCDGSRRYGVLEGERLRRLPDGLFGALEPTDATDDLSSVKILCPVPNPRIFGVELNYGSELSESGRQRPKRPMLYMKPSSAAIGPGEPIVLPRESRIVHHAAELAAVIGRRGRRLSREDAADAILGYTCANDVGDQQIQRTEMAMGGLLIAKGFDSFCPLGPMISTGLDPMAGLRIDTHVNGGPRQRGSTSDMLYSPAELVSYISQAITLLPGDVILTGTPAGAATLAPGDLVEVTIEGIGMLANPVAAERVAGLEGGGIGAASMVR